jgi:uncharacterized membrane protein YbhN (UPF0104 family)
MDRAITCAGRLPTGWRLRRRLIAGVAGTALILLVLGRLEWLRVAWLVDAWRQERHLLIWMALLQAAMTLLNGVRYHGMLRACGVGAGLGRAVGATCISSGISVWLPASAGVAEIFRLGLIGRGREANPLERLGRVTLASVMDRLLGLLVVFLLAATFSGFALLAGLIPVAALPAAGWMGGGNLLAAGGLIWMIRWCMRGRAPNHERLSRRRAETGGLLGSLVGTLGIVLTALRSRAVRPRDLLPPAALATFCFLLFGVITGLSIHAIGGAVPFAWVVAALPLLILASVLPVSVGGLGGPQVAGVFAFGLLGCEPAVIASAGLLNAAVVLAVNTLLALGFMPLFLSAWKAR